MKNFINKNSRRKLLKLKQSRQKIFRRKSQNPNNYIEIRHFRWIVIRDIVILITGFIGLGLAVWAVVLALDTFKDQRISAAWQILAQPGKQSTGKRYALEILVSETDESLSGLDFGCDKEDIVGEGFWSSCISAMDFSNATYKGGDPKKRRVLDRFNFDYVNIYNSIFESIIIKNSSFKNTKLNSIFINSIIEDSTFKNSDISGEFIGSYLSEVIFKESAIKAKFIDSNLFNTSFKNVTFGKYSSDPHGSFGFFNAVFNSVSFRNSDIAKITMTIRQPESSPSVEDQYYDYKGSWFEISGAIICNESSCTKGLNQEFFNDAWFVKNNPPIGLEYLPPEMREKIKIRAGCEVLDENTLDKDAKLWISFSPYGNYTNIFSFFYNSDVSNGSISFGKEKRVDILSYGENGLIYYEKCKNSRVKINEWLLDNTSINIEDLTYLPNLFNSMYGFIINSQ